MCACIYVYIYLYFLIHLNTFSLDLPWIHEDIREDSSGFTRLWESICKDS